VQVIPAIDLLGREAVRLEQGDYARVTEYGEPTELAARFAAAGARWIHVVDLDGARAGLIRPVVVAALVHASSPASVQASGGVRSVADAVALAEAGIARVIVGTAAFGELPLQEFVAALGERLVVSIDVAGGIVRTAGWLESSELTTRQGLARCGDAGVGHVVCTAIDRDGARGGPDLELLAEVRASFGGSILAAGGIRDAGDVEAVRALGIDGVVVGRAWLDGTLEL
jgi:phosphoribosylformimino-5-aminoimidazole carboxamide ribotide isomerase